MNKYHKIYDDFPCIEDEIFNLIYIPLMDRYNKVTSYAISNLGLKDKLLKFSYHQIVSLNKNENKYAISSLGPSMHEIVIGGKADQGYVIDHIDSNGLLNTEENLRYATRGLNAQNKIKRSNTISKYIGVSFDNNKWTSKMCYNKKPLYLGSFEDEIEAGKVYDMHVIYYYKDESPKTNELLSDTEIKNIRKNGIPEKYIKKSRALPKNIATTSNNTYIVNIVYDGQKYTKRAKTLEDAIIVKKQFLQKIEEIKKNIKTVKFSKEITRNIDGLAVIYTSNGFECIVDDDHWHDINQYKWNCYKNEDDKFYGYPLGYVNGNTLKLHRYVYEKYVGPIPTNMSIDHIISKNKFDVRLQNLRLADSSLQAHNKDMSQNRIDQYKGIEFSNSGFRVKIKKHNYGTYKTAEEAAQKANEVYTAIYGNQATLNVIDFSKQTTKYNRIPEENITKEYIMGLTKVIDVKNVVTIKGLNPGKGGAKLNDNKIKIKDIKLENLEEYKQIIVDKLYSSTD